MDSKIHYIVDGSGPAFWRVGFGSIWLLETELGSGRAGLIEKCCEAGLLLFQEIGVLRVGSGRVRLGLGTSKSSRVGLTIKCCGSGRVAGRAEPEPTSTLK